jgi:hypothetical protein
MTCHDSYLSLHPEVECTGCEACIPVDCPSCAAPTYFAAGEHPGCVHCGYIEGVDDCATCGAPLPFIGYVMVAPTERYHAACYRHASVVPFRARFGEIASTSELQAAGMRAAVEA